LPVPVKALGKTVPARQTDTLISEHCGERSVNSLATILLPNSVARDGTQRDSGSPSAEFAKQFNTPKDRTERKGMTETEFRVRE
jgi:hypothetical protein